MKNLDEFLKSSRLSASALARAIGVSSAAISQYRKGEYKGDLASLAKKINQYITNYSDKKQDQPKSEIYASLDFKMANFIINEAVGEREIALLYGEPGTGKTTALREYAKSHSNAVLIEVTPHTSARVILEDLCEALKITPPKTLRAMLKAVAKFLGTADKVLLIDEAEHLPLKALEDLRRIADFSKTPIILCGTGILLRNLVGRDKELKQLYSRICGKYEFKGLSKEESAQYYGEHIYEFAKGNFRASSKLFKKALKLAEFRGTAINKEIAAKATQMVIL